MKKVFGVLMALGMILSLGTAGASDCNTIPESQVWIQLAIATILMLAGFAGIYIIERAEIAKGNRHNKVLLWETTAQKRKRPSTSDAENAFFIKNVNNYYNHYINR